MRRNNHLSLLLGILFSIGLITAEAAEPQSGVRDQPISIFADQLTIDDSTGISIYQGHVELQQGDLKFSGDRLELTQKDGEVTQMQATGKPAHFERSEPKMLKADAKQIDYDNQKGEVILRGDAHLLQEGDRFSGELIHYYTESRRVQALGGPKAQQGNGRVHVLIRPKQDKSQEGEK